MKKLIDFYYSDYKKVLNDYYIDLIGNKFFLIIKNFLLFFLVDIVFNIILVFSYSFKFKFLLFLFFNVFIVILFFLKIRKGIKKIYRIMNESVIKDMLNFISDGNVVYNDCYQIKENVFKTMDIFNYNNLNYRGSNVGSVSYKDHFVLFSDVSLFVYDVSFKHEFVNIAGKNYIRKIIKKNKKDIFKGLYLEFSMCKKINSNIYLVPNNVNDRFLSQYINYHGDRVLLEDIKFSKRYSVYSSDQVDARYVLSIDMMDRINRLDSIVENKKYIVFKNNSTMGIFICDYTIDSIKDSVIPIKRNDEIEINYLTSIYDKLNIIVSSYDILNLDNDLYI